MPTLKIPVETLMLCGLKPEIYMAERLKAAGAPIEIKGNEIKQTGTITQEDDPEKKFMIFTWEDTDG
jgi:hypothetical protein